MDFWESLRRAGSLVDVVSAEVTGIVDDFLDGEGGEVLVAEGCGALVSKFIDLEMFGIEFPRSGTYQLLVAEQRREPIGPCQPLKACSIAHCGSQSR